MLNIDHCFGGQYVYKPNEYTLSIYKPHRSILITNRTESENNRWNKKQNIQICKIFIYMYVTQKKLIL